MANSIDGTKISLTGQQTNDLMYYDGANWVRTAGWHYDIAFIAGFDSDNVAENVSVKRYGQMVMARTGTFEGEAGYIDTQSAGSALICDVEKNGTSIYSTKPEFAAGASNITAGTLSTTTFASGDRITFRVTQIGSGTAGQGARFMLKCKA